MIFRTFFFSPYPQMPSITSKPSSPLDYYHSLLLGFLICSVTPLQFIFHVPTRMIFSSILLRLQMSSSSMNSYFSSILENFQPLLLQILLYHFLYFFHLEILIHIFESCQYNLQVSYL